MLLTGGAKESVRERSGTRLSVKEREGERCGLAATLCALGRKRVGRGEKREGERGTGPRGVGLEPFLFFLFLPFPFYFIFCFLFLKPFPNKIVNANKFKPEANNTNKIFFGMNA